jgi:hypothetical protein
LLSRALCRPRTNKVQKLTDADNLGDPGHDFDDHMIRFRRCLFDMLLYSCTPKDEFRECPHRTTFISGSKLFTNIKIDQCHGLVLEYQVNGNAYVLLKEQTGRLEYVTTCTMNFGKIVCHAVHRNIGLRDKNQPCQIRIIYNPIDNIGQFEMHTPLNSI